MLNKVLHMLIGRHVWAKASAVRRQEQVREVLSTTKDNEGIKSAGVRGEQHHNAKLTAESVRAIREAGKNNTRAAIAEQFGVSISTVYSVLSGGTWQSVE